MSMPEVLSILAALCSALACVLVWRMSSSMGASQGNNATLDRIKDKLDTQDTQLRDEFARNRKETAELAQAQISSTFSQSAPIGRFSMLLHIDKKPTAQLSTYAAQSVPSSTKQRTS